MKRKDYVDAFEQIEEAIKEEGGDGDPSLDGEDLGSENNVRIIFHIKNDTGHYFNCVNFYLDIP